MTMIKQNIVRVSLRMLDRKSYKISFRVALLIVVLIVSSYLLFFQADRYASTAKLVVRQLANFESSSLSLSNILSGNVGKSDDSSIIIEYIRSREMMQYLDEKLDLRRLFSRKEADVFSSMSSDADEDSLYSFYLQFVKAKTSNDSPIINLEVQGFNSDDAEEIAELIIKQSESFINKISKDTARQQLDFIRKEVVISEENILSAQEDLQKIQEKFNAPDPSAEVLSTVTLISELEKKLSFNRIDLNKINASQSDSTAAKNIESEIKAIDDEIQKQKQRIIKTGSEDIAENMNMLFEYKNSERKLDFAVDAHKAALAAQEKVRTTSAQNLKKLVVITGPTTESEARYPNRLYNLSLFLCSVALIYYIIKATYSAILSHRAIQ